MNAGKIEQLGTPDDLYGAPKSRFAADFFGFENIFEVHGDTITRAGRTLKLGFNALEGHIAWRPGAVEVGVGPYTGIVRGSAFAGEQREYVIESPIGTIQAAAPVATPQYQLGEEIRFALPQERALVLPK